MTGYLSASLLAMSLVSAHVWSTAPAVPQDDQAALLTLQQVLAKAWMSGDRATIERIIAEDWRSTGPDGRMADRASVLAEVFDKGIHKIRKLDIDDVSARVFGDAAVVTGRTQASGEFDGSSYDVVIRFTDTFVRRDGRWQAVASHASVLTAR
jgi:ketosteroid isomerase-like protein